MKNYVAVPALCLLACCSIPKPEPTPAPPPPAAAPPPPPPVAALPPAARWEDWPYTPGAWRYGTENGASVARFSAPGGAPLFVMRCSPGVRTIAFVRTGAAATAGTMAFTTSSGTAAYAVQSTAEGIIATTSASDPYLDKIAFTRGRFVVAAAGTGRLVLPSWAEVSRVIEDCR